MIHRLKIFIVFGVLVFIGGCATAPKRPSISFIPDQSLVSVCKRNNISWEWDSFAHIITLKKNHRTAQLLVGSNTVFLDDQVVLLTRPVVMKNSQIILPNEFKVLVIDPLKKKVKLDLVENLPVRIHTIILDAGHGGKDPGATSKSGLKEKEVVLDITRRLRKELKSRGYEILLTRRDDTFISLAKRTEIASKSAADLFISVHANANNSRGVHGLEIYALRNLSALEKNESQRKDNHQLLFKNLDIDQTNGNVRRIVADLLYSHKQEETLKLAPYVAKVTAKHIRARNRGMKRARFFVLRNTLIPAILVEVGYLTNPKEERLLKTGAYRQKIAQGLAKSITNYINGKK